MPCILLLIPPLAVKGGNYITVSRIRSHFEKHGHICLLWDVTELEMESSGSGDVDHILKNHQVDLIIGIHAYRTGKVLKDCSVPFVMILDGTDVNEFWKDEDRMAVMTTAVKQARFVIAFSKSLQDKALRLWPGLLQNRLAVITQDCIVSEDDLQRRLAPLGSSLVQRIQWHGPKTEPCGTPKFTGA